MRALFFAGRDRSARPTPSPQTFRAGCTKTARSDRSLFGMRNPIPITADRPFPLPDRVLSDGWWLIERARPVERAALRLVGREEDASERHRSEGQRTEVVVRI
jgi:hypothetical protein